jgi:hypothetical protein
MLKLTIQPHIGVGPIRLGMMRSEIRDIMLGLSAPLESSQGASDYYFAASIQVEFESDGTASFIGVSSHSDILLNYDGADVFDLEAPAVFELFAKRDKSGEHRFNQNEYIFPSQILTLYDADPQYDQRRGESRSVWGQIGVGDERYLTAILQINKGSLNPELPKKK